jgi:Zn-dependent protease
MFSILQHVGPEIPFTLILLALLGLRANVIPRTSLWIKASPEKLWGLIDTYDGKFENWGRTVVHNELVDPDTRMFRKTYSTTLLNGTQRPSTAYFKITQRHEDKLIELERCGLEGKSLNNELLKITHCISPENGGSRLKTTYHWGSRPFIAQLLARADLWSGAYRLKGLAETGKPNERPYIIISAAVAMITGLVTLGGFSVMLGLTFSLLLVFALFIHEFGHLLAFRLMGQPWGRMIFLPFLGAIAMPRLTFETQGQAVFAALMGPGLSTLLAIACTTHVLLGNPLNPLLCVLGVVTTGLNLFNLLPAEPLDGGIALRSVLNRLIGARAHYGLMLIGALIVSAGFWYDQIILVIFGGLAILANLKSRNIDAGLAPLSPLQLAISAFGYVAITTAHVTLLRFFIVQASLLPT